MILFCRLREGPGRRILPDVLCMAEINVSTSDQTCFHFHRQISWRIAWVTLPDAPNQKLCCETTQQLKQNTGCFFLQLQHNGFNYSCGFRKTAAAQIKSGLIFCPLSAAAALDSDRYRQRGRDIRPERYGMYREPTMRCSLLSVREFDVNTQQSHKDRSY